MAAIKARAAGPVVALVSLSAFSGMVYATVEFSAETLAMSRIPSQRLQIAAQMWSNVINQRLIATQFIVSGEDIVNRKIENLDDRFEDNISESIKF